MFGLNLIKKEQVQPQNISGSQGLRQLPQDLMMQEKVSKQPGHPQDRSAPILILTTFSWRVLAASLSYINKSLSLTWFVIDFLEGVFEAAILVIFGVEMQGKEKALLRKRDSGGHSPINWIQGGFPTENLQFWGEMQIISDTLPALLEIWTTSNSRTWLLADLKIGILS